MHNKAMQRKLESGHCIDVSGYPRYGGAYILPQFWDGKDYCNAQTERWIWSIGRRSDGVILASHSTEFYGNAEFECLWLR